MERVIAIVGATCSGKTTLAQELVARGCAQVVTTTSREPRAGEIQGRDYWFVGPEEFIEMQSDGRFLEHTEFAGGRYGISHRALQDAYEEADTVVAVVTPEGCEALERWSRRNGLTFRSVFLTARARVLRERLRTERSDGQARLRELVEQVRYWRHRTEYDLVIPGRRTGAAADELLESIA